MKWQIEWLKPAAKDLERLERRVAEQIVRKVEWLAQNLDQVPMNRCTVDGQDTSNCELAIGEWSIPLTGNGV